tara:strand:- start:62 stop:1075 length:1014 start_codon:yes stop_codon:yes gene_type:complete
MSLNVCIFGVSGYTGSKLLCFLDKHKNINIHGVFGNSTYGRKLGDLFHNLQNSSKIKITNYEEFNFNKTDLIFSCLPNGKLQKEIVNNLDPKIPIIDLSGDFRLESNLDYEKFYECSHKSRKLQKKFSYGLSEIYRQQIKKAKFISNPGCYPTSILIPLIPLIKEKTLSIKDIIIDSKSGISGAGKQPKIENLFSEISGNFFSYGIKKHKHYPEIKQEIGKIDNKIAFTFIPHILPIVSGIQSTIYIEKKTDEKDYIKILSDSYENEPFIKIYSGSRVPSVKDVFNTNNVAMNVFSDYSKKKIVIVSCIDNLVKGAAGQAVQNMNIMFNFDEMESLI